MTVTLPSGFVRQTIEVVRFALRTACGAAARPAFAGLAIAVVSLVLAAACRHEGPAVAPGPPLPAEPDVVVSTMEAECTAMQAALTSYRACKNLDDDGRYEIDGWLERAQIDYAAGVKAKPEPKAQHAIAVACRRATTSVTAAHERCNAGPPPRDR